MFNPRLRPSIISGVRSAQEEPEKARPLKKQVKEPRGKPKIRVRAGGG
jgi:hypothetical protein